MCHNKLLRCYYNVSQYSYKELSEKYSIIKMRKKVGVDTLRRENGEKENHELPQTTFDNNKKYTGQLADWKNQEIDHSSLIQILI